MPLFFLSPESITSSSITISGELFTHLRNGLRTTVGEALLIGDGQGRRYRTEVTAVNRQGVTARIVETLVEPPSQTPGVILGQALLKGDKMDWIIQKATELGVHAIVPLQSRHSVVQPRPDRIGAQTTRWQRIALEAAQQSEQWQVASVKEPRLLSTCLKETAHCTRLILTERRGTSASLRTADLPTSPEHSIALLIGPEGGWAEEEILEAEEAGCTLITLGPRILRAETAALTALAIVQHRLGGLG